MNFGDAKEQIRQKVDIVDLVGSSIPLRRAGRNYAGLCPWHADSKPSLNVNPERQTWKCWVCDIGGDIFSFVMQREGCDFVQALKMLAERAGINLDEGHKKKIEPGSPDDKNTLYQCCDWAAKQFHEYLLRSEAAEVARNYIEERAITPASVEKFKIGFAADQWTWLIDRARTTPYSPAVLEACGLVGNKDGRFFDFFKGRVMFPIRDTQGRTIAFGGRVLPQLADGKGGKYINTRETKLFSKSEQLYALDIVRNAITKSRSITVVEGYTDVIMCHQYGVDDVVAVLGTALTERHLPLIRRFADRVNLVLDGDAAGQNRTNDILELFVAANMDLRILTLPDEFDPAEFLVERGGEAFRELMDGAVDALEHKIRVATRGIDLVRESHKANQALEEILATLSRGLPPGTLDASALRANQLLSRLAREFRLEIADVRERFMQLRKNVAAKSPGRPVAADGMHATERTYKLVELSPRECELLELFVLHPELAPTALSEIAEDDLAAEAAKLLFRAYRQLEEAGESLDFQVVLAQVEEPSLKNLLVQLDDVATKKQVKVNLDPASRMRSVISKFQQHHVQRQLRDTEAKLEQNHFNPEEEVDVLKSMIAAQRRQQGIIAPTEG
ncbi:MAG: DNA primase [Pirellulaceae bacterium]